MLLPAAACLVILCCRPGGLNSDEWPQDGGARYKNSASETPPHTAFWKLPRGARQFVWAGLTLRAADLTTDWAF